MNNFLINLPQFPAFTWNTDVLHPILLDLRTKQGQLIERMETLPLGFKELVNAQMVEKEAFSHIFIENNANFTQKEAKNAIFLLKEINPKYQQTLTKELLFKCYNDISAIFSDQRIDNQCLLNEQTEILLDQFLVWFNKPGLDRILKAAIAHLWFVAINPFPSHTSAIARIIADLQLAKADGTGLRYYSMSEQIAKEKSEYQFILQQALRGSLDITIWLQWFLNCLKRAYDTAAIISAPIIEKANFWKANSDIQFNKRQLKILEKLLLGQLNELTTTAYAIYVSCSRDTALRDVTDLMQKGVLFKTGGLGKNTEYRIKY